VDKSESLKIQKKSETEIRTKIVLTTEKTVIRATATEKIVETMTKIMITTKTIIIMNLNMNALVVKMV
jgi:hypothetical protein